MSKQSAFEYLMDLQSKMEEVLEFPDGRLIITFGRRTDRPTNILPNEPYIWIYFIEAIPRHGRLLQKYASTVIARIQDRLGDDAPILFVADADRSPGNMTSQANFEQYYLSCGFTWYRGEGKLISWPKIGSGRNDGCGC